MHLSLPLVDGLEQLLKDRADVLGGEEGQADQGVEPPAEGLVVEVAAHSLSLDMPQHTLSQVEEAAASLGTSEGLKKGTRPAEKARGLRRAFSKSALSRKMNMPPVTGLESGQSRAAQRRDPSFSEPMQYLLSRVAVA